MLTKIIDKICIIIASLFVLCLLLGVLNMVFYYTFESPSIENNENNIINLNINNEYDKRWFSKIIIQCLVEEREKVYPFSSSVNEFVEKAKLNSDIINNYCLSKKLKSTINIDASYHDMLRNKLDLYDIKYEFDNDREKFKKLIK